MTDRAEPARHETNTGERRIRASLQRALTAWRNGDPRAPDPTTYEGWFRTMLAVKAAAAATGVDEDAAREAWINWSACMEAAANFSREACEAKWAHPSNTPTRITDRSLFFWEPGARARKDQEHGHVPIENDLEDDSRTEEGAEAASGVRGASEQAQAVYELAMRVRGDGDDPPITGAQAARLARTEIAGRSAGSPRAAILEEIAGDEAVRSVADVETYLPAWNVAGGVAAGEVSQEAPDPVLWYQQGDGPRSPVCSVGEPMMLAAPGGGGKTWMSLSIALAAAAKDDDGDMTAPSTPAMGMHVRCGPVVYWSYEESAGRLKERLDILVRPRPGIPQTDDQRQAVRQRAARLRFALSRLILSAGPPAPLWEQAEFGRGLERSAGWDVLTDLLSTVRPSLVFLDAATGITGGADMNSGSVVSTVLRDLALLSETTGAGIVVIAHDTKSGRSAVKDGELPGAQAIAGSAQWHDRARGVLYLWTGPSLGGVRIEDADGTRQQRVLCALKCNHGPGRFGVEVVPAASQGEGWRGLTAGQAYDDFETEIKNRLEGLVASSLCNERLKNGEPCTNQAVVNGRCKKHLR